MRALLGGRLRIMAVGGAPLSPDTHNFVRVSLGVPVLQVSKRELMREFGSE